MMQKSINHSLTLFTSTTKNHPLLSLYQITTHFSASASSHAPQGHFSNASYHSRRQEEESRNVRVSVWWDFENCNLSAGANVFRIAHSITAAVRANGIKGPIQITAFGDIMQLSRANQEALSSTGIVLTHIPNGGKNSADRSLLIDLMYWVSQNPPPAHLFLISGDRDFAGILHRLRMNNYNILLASPETAPGVLCSAASIMWQWSTLLKGEDLTGKHFNQPPDGPYNSWYGHYRAPLEDAFASAEQLSCQRAIDVPDSASDSRVRPIPKAVVKQIRHILNSHPNGISITELRAELSKSNVTVDKDLYGYRKFSRFLYAMPQILKLQVENDGQFMVLGKIAKSQEQCEGAPCMQSGYVTNSTGADLTSTTNLNNQNSSQFETTKEPSSVLYSETNLECAPKSHKPTAEQKSMSQLVDPARNLTKVSRERRKSASPVDAVGDAKAAEGHLQTAELSQGILKRIRRWWFGDEDNTIKDKPSSECKEASEETKSKENKANVTSLTYELVGQNSSSPLNGKASIENKIAQNSKSIILKSNSVSSYLNQIISRFKFWRSSTDLDDAVEGSCKEVVESKSNSERNELFLKKSFWTEMRAFLDTPQGSTLVSESTNRLQLALDLQKQGPLFLQSLSEQDLLLLVDMLISDKKWVEECPSQNSPFILTGSGPAEKGSLPSNHYSSNGLSSIFAATRASSSSCKLGQLTDDRKQHNPPHAGFSKPVTQKKSSSRSRSEILLDCQKLVRAIVKEYPEGYNIGAFRKLFLERYGYSLDVQKLGYQKLVNLLQIMPGARIESTFLVPCGEVSNSSRLQSVDSSIEEGNIGAAAMKSGSSDVSKKDDEDSPWEELGPVSKVGVDSSGKELGSSKTTEEETKQQKHDDYESLSDDVFSDSEDEPSEKLESEKRSRASDEDSSLLHILDSWYSSKEESTKKDPPDGGDVLVDCADKSARPSALAGSGPNTDTQVNSGRKLKPSKNYSFVADQPADKKDKLINGILGSLRKSGERSNESRMQG